MVMNKEELEALEKLKGYSLEEIGKELAKMTKSKYKIKKDEEYYFLSASGNISRITFQPIMRIGDKEQLTVVECFKLEQEAIEYKKYRKAYMRIINKIRKLNAGWTPTFKERMFFISYDFMNMIKLVIKDTLCISYLPKVMYLKSEELACQLIEENASDLITMFNYENYSWLEVAE